MTRRILLQTSLVQAVLGPATRATPAFDTLARRIFDRINELRERSGTDPLRWSQPVAQCAAELSLRKVRLRFPGHQDPERGNVDDRLRAAGIPWERCGENVFSERGYADPVHFAVVFWWYSPGHKGNLLNPDFTETGVGVAQGADGTFYVTQIFLLPPPVKRR